jgi:hypothetical protein
MALGTEQAGASHAQMRILTNIFRRAYRIFAHAWFQHREVFWKVENQTGLYLLFKTVCEQYNLIPDDGYTVPPEAEGKAPREISDHPAVPIILSQDTAEKQSVSSLPSTKDISTSTREKQDPENSSLSAVNTTKRHRQTPSADLGAILDVLDEKEEEDPAAESRKPSFIKTPETSTPEPPKPTITSSVPVTEETNVEVPESVSKSTESSEDTIPEPDHEKPKPETVPETKTKPVADEPTAVTTEPTAIVKQLEVPELLETISPLETKMENPIISEEKPEPAPEVEEVVKAEDKADVSKEVEEKPVTTKEDVKPTEEESK